MSVITEIEVEGKKILSWLAQASTKLESASPKAIAALATLAGAAAAAMQDAAAAGTASGLNILLDEKTVADLKAVWPDFVAFLASLGIKL